MGTSRSPFLRYLEGEGLSFGLEPELLARIESRTREGAAIGELLDDPDLAGAGVGPTHLLRIRRAFHRLRAKDKPDPSAAARRWAVRHAPDPAEQDRLASAFSAAVQATLKRGRLRFHLKRPDHAPEDLVWLAEHTEGCDELPAHRWFAARRGIKDGLVWVDVLAPGDEVERALGPLASGELIDDLARALQKSVLDAVTARSEREVISTAADGLYGLLSRPPIQGPVAGVAVTRKRIWVCVLDSEGSEEQNEFGIRDLDGVAAFVNKNGASAVGVARAGGSGSVSEVIKSLAGLGLTVEPVRETGLMKQASKRPGPIKASAAVVVAWRMKNPLDGYAGLDADELGLGEYTDQVNPDSLRAALEDARQVVGWERKHGKTGRPVARGMDISPMVKGLADLRPGMELTGSVANLTHFGAFVELGLATQGLIHLSELSDSYIKHPSEVVQVGDRVRVRVLEVDQKKNRISLSMRSESKQRGQKSRDRRGAALAGLDKLFKK